VFLVSRTASPALHGHNFAVEPFGDGIGHPMTAIEDGFPLAAVLRPGNPHDSYGAVTVLKRLLPRLRAAHPEALILVRADAGFAIPAFYEFLEEHDVRYVIGFITNNRLLKQTASLAQKATDNFQATGVKQLLFTAFTYQADSWDHPRRIIAKVEYTAKGLNQRFLVTNLHRNSDGL
jgi:hypothetical protein